MTGAQRLKRVFGIDIETRRRCGGRLRVIARSEQSATGERVRRIGGLPTQIRSLNHRKPRPPRCFRFSKHLSPAPLQPRLLPQ